MRRCTNRHHAHTKTHIHLLPFSLLEARLPGNLQRGSCLAHTHTHTHTRNIHTCCRFYCRRRGCQEMCSEISVWHTHTHTHVHIHTCYRFHHWRRGCQRICSEVSVGTHTHTHTCTFTPATDSNAKGKVSVWHTHTHTHSHFHIHTCYRLHCWEQLKSLQRGGLRQKRTAEQRVGCRW